MPILIDTDGRPYRDDENTEDDAAYRSIDDDSSSSSARSSDQLSLPPFWKIITEPNDTTKSEQG